ncbi:TetR/AcrR family transcriptional regulator [Microbispora sp. NEAU-D428]|uniref:TetR/AcrR family transcriptional regulator n=1 Tax=Microbispora sitophila TaxID=2771537 RepID=UPI001867A148|nr:TetR/AcrR family transcriptional regulator [Microbispora sitophila]MBE3012692.1 TetR/AcrR family transcriptional regulator [Microbispora sitophila]
MDGSDRPGGPRRGRPAKNEAITRAARAVFGRDGYARTSTDAIAREAGVSTRTLYKHFGSKERLFSVVLAESATRVADAFAEYVERGLREASGLEERLIAVGRALVAHRVDFPEHFALVEMINVEGPHFPRQLLEEWREAGPLRVRGEVARRLGELAAEGLLRIADARRTALHFIALATFEASNLSAEGPLTGEQITDMVTAGVRAFLDGYRRGED